MQEGSQCGSTASGSAGGEGWRSRLDETIHRVRKLGAIAEPVVETSPIELDRTRSVERIEGSEFLYEASIAPTSLISDDDSIEGLLLGALAREPNMNCHISSCEESKGHS